MSYTHYYPNSNILHCSTHKIMGTQLDMLMVGSDKTKLLNTWQRIETRLLELELMMSRFNEGAELYLLNREAKERKFKPTNELWGILDSCFNYYSETNGYFDITLGYRSFVNIDYNLQAIEILDSSVSLDLGGYGKGYALSEIKKIIDDSDIKDIFITFGNSSIMARGHHPCYDCWNIATKNPYNGESLDNFELYDTTLTVSGNSPSHPKHIYDPYKSIFNTQHRIVAVMCDDPTVGEVLSTTGMLMSEDSFRELCKRYNVNEPKINEL